MGFFFNDTATTEIYTLSLHDALPISLSGTYYYKVSASDGTGWTDTFSEVSETVDGGTTDGTITIAWSAVTGATKYRVWRGTATDSEDEYYETTSTSVNDDGSIAFTTGTVPSVTTAYVNKIVPYGDRDRKSTRLNSSHIPLPRMPSSA